MLPRGLAPSITFVCLGALHGPESMGEGHSTVCQPARGSNLCRSAGNEDENRHTTFIKHERCGMLCSEYNGQGKDELRVNRVFDQRLDGLWFDDALFQDAKLGTSEDPERARRRIRAARRRLFMPHVRHRFADWYQMGRKLGDGASAEVHQASARSVDPTTGLPSGDSVSSRRVAVKVFRLDVGGGDRKLAPAEIRGQQEFFKAEWEMLAQLEHPHIVRMYECFKDTTALYIVMELCLGGELIEYVKEISRQRGKGGLEEAGARKLFKQMLYAGSYLHSNKIVHRDVKLENFLLVGDLESKGSDLIKLCDFGTAVYLTDRAPRAYGRIGTLSYTSPEVCADRGATVLADAWSLGVVLYVLLVGAKPFRSKVEEPRDETMRRIQMGAYNQARPGWKAMSSGSRDLVKKLITVEEISRITSWDALKHSWLAKDPTANGNRNSPRDGASSEDDAEDAGNEALRGLADSAYDELRMLSQATTLDPLQRFVLGLCARLTCEADLLAKSLWTTWYHLFFTLDMNKDGVVDFAEIARGMWTVMGPTAGLSAGKLGNMVRAVDLNASGSIEWSEWAAAAMMSTNSFSCKDELLTNALRLIRRNSASDEPLARDKTEELPNDGKFEPRSVTRDSQEDSLAPDSTERSTQVRELLSSWINPQEDLIANLANESAHSSAPEVGLEDLREVLRSTLWISSKDEFQLGSATPRQSSTPSPRDTAMSKRDSEFDLAASPMPSPRGDSWLSQTPLGKSVVSGPIVAPSAPCFVSAAVGGGDDSEPNSPRGFHRSDSSASLSDK